MKKLAILFIALVLVSGCSSKDYVTEDTIEGDTSNLVKHEVAEGDYTFYSKLQFEDLNGMYQSELTGEKYSIITKQISEERINDDNYDEIFMQATRWTIGKDEDTINSIYNIEKEKIEIRGVTVYKVNFIPNPSNTRMGVLESVAYLIPYENGTVEVSVSGLKVENDDLNDVLNTIY